MQLALRVAAVVAVLVTVLSIWNGVSEPERPAPTPQPVVVTPSMSEQEVLRLVAERFNGSSRELYFLPSANVQYTGGGRWTVDLSKSKAAAQASPDSPLVQAKWVVVEAERRVYPNDQAQVFERLSN